MTKGQCNANYSHGFLLTVCLGIVTVAGMPEARINLKFVFSACFLHHFCQLQFCNGFLLSLFTWQDIGLLAACVRVRVLDNYYLARLFFKQDCCNACPLSDIRYKPTPIVSISVTSLVMAIF
jgi:hypothetical protein